MKPTHYEDLIIKRAMNIFADEGLKFFGINKKVKAIGPTELVSLGTESMYMDYTFLMEDDTFIRFEFETSNNIKENLRKFMVYESLLSYETGKDVVTYVVYSGNIKNVESVLKTGINEYKIKAISMADKDGDKIYNDIVTKIKNRVQVTKQDIISLIFTPIMGGSVDKVDKLINAIRIVKKLDKQYRYDVQSILFAFSNKFLKKKDLERVKEELMMTELGKSLIEEGKKSKTIEIAKKAIKKGLDNEIIKELTDLDIEEIVLIREVLK